MSREVTPDSEVPPTLAFTRTSPRKTSLSECGNGNGLSNTASTIENTAVVAPIPSASINTAVVVKAGDLSEWRIAIRRSGKDIGAGPLRREKHARMGWRRVRRTGRSFIPERHHWINARCTSRRNRARGQRDAGKGQRHSG